jgi:DNA repair exonuclease SbcCD ATPase subunit
MIELKRVHATDLVTYRELDFEFTPGIHAIRGDNGSGKSISMNTLPTLLYSSLPTTTDKRRGRALHSKGTSIELDLNSDGNEWHFGQFGKSSGVRYEVSKNGKSQETHRQDDATDFISKAFPLNIDQFYTTVFLSAFRGNVLHTGNGPKRHDFFESLFDLQVYDTIHKKLSARHSELRGRAQSLDYLKSEVAELQGDEPLKDRVARLDAEMTDARIRRDKLERAIGRRESKYSRLTAQCAIMEQIQSEGTAEHLALELTKQQKRLTRLKEKWRGAVENRKLYDHAREVADKRSALKAKLKALPKRELVDVKALVARLEALDVKADEAERVWAKNKKLNKVMEEIEAAAFPSSVVQAAAELRRQHESKSVAFVASKLRSLEDLIASIEALLGDGAHICPTCGQDAHRDKLRPHLQDLKKDAAHTDSLLACVELFDIRDKLMSDIGDDTEVVDPAIIAAKIEALEDELEQGRSINAACRERVLIKDKLDSLPVVEAVEQGEDPDTLEDRVSEVEAAVNRLRNDIKLMEKLDEGIDASSFTARDDLGREIGSLTAKLRKVNDAMHSMSSDMAVSKDDLIKLRRVRKEIAEIETDVEDLDVYQGLLAAYGQRGLRVNHIATLAEMFEDNLNMYSPSIFNEPFSFAINVDNAKFDIVATRAGKSAEINGSLSGSESRRFQLLCLPSILPFIPAACRTNAVILDELESGMKMPARLKYVHDFLPLLATVVKTIVVVTPLPPEELPVQGREWSVTKTNGVSILRAL